MLYKIHAPARDVKQAAGNYTYKRDDLESMSLQGSSIASMDEALNLDFSDMEDDLLETASNQDQSETLGTSQLKEKQTDENNSQDLEREYISKETREKFGKLLKIIRDTNQCSLCMREFDKLNKEQQRAHCWGHLVIVACPMCGYLASRGDTVYQHMRKTHKSERAHQGVRIDPAHWAKARSRIDIPLVMPKLPYTASRTMNQTPSQDNNKKRPLKPAEDVRVILDKMKNKRAKMSPIRSPPRESGLSTSITTATTPNQETTVIKDKPSNTYKFKQPAQPVPTPEVSKLERQLHNKTLIYHHLKNAISLLEVEMAEIKNGLCQLRYPTP